MSKRRILLLIGLGLGLILAISLILRDAWPKPSRADIDTAITALWNGTGDRPLKITGEDRFHLFPLPEFRLTHAVIATERGVSISADDMIFSFDLSSLITGSFTPTRLQIIGANIVLPPTVPLPSKQTAEKFVIALFSFFDRDTSAKPDKLLQSMTITDAKFQFGDASASAILPLRSAKFTRQANGALDIAATLDTLNLNATNLDTASRIVAIQAAIGGRESDMSKQRMTRFSLHSDTFDLSGDGATIFDANLQFLGIIQFKAKNLKSFGTLFTHHVTTLPNAAGALSSQARLSFSSMTLSDLRLKIGASDISGNVGVDFAPATPRLTGTLAATTLDLSDLSDVIGIKRDALGNWSTDPLPRELIPDLDMDMRVSSNMVAIHDITISGIALSALVRDHTAELTLASANLFDGTMSGKLQLTDKSDRSHYEINLSLVIDAIDLEKAGLALLDSKRITGATSGRVTLHGKGQSSAEIMSNLAGDAVINLDDTSVMGIDLLAFLHRVEARPIGAVTALKTGKTGFDQGQIILRIDHGVSKITTGKLTKYPDLQVRLAGEIDLAKRQLAISGHALASSAQSAERAIDLPFSLQGPFDDPAFVPEFTNVTKQSGTITP